MLDAVVRGIGHETVAAELDVATVGATTAREHPDVALVAVGENDAHALELISMIVAESTCPVIAVVSAPDTDFVREAARRGIFAYVTDSDQEALESALEIVLLRFREYHGLEGAFGRRALIERAKGILMERHGISERTAFESLRAHARRNNLKIVDVSSAVITGHAILPRRS